MLAVTWATRRRCSSRPTSAGPETRTLTRWPCNATESPRTRRRRLSAQSNLCLPFRARRSERETASGAKQATPLPFLPTIAHMLKRLELVGFKSFAEKTLFDFSSGITAIVGPNGSGKSNIVDAVRWVLGEQSAKSLRGGEMADVIFQGSATRRSLGMAEVTMTFDNSRRPLATEAEEVQITRRVYRGGEGEYLINQQPSRLKDIKELFLGSGAGADAYCVIEQGRVDVFLQASTKERRTIFEEAAGISRFKAKKIETVRKLERVDQNLQRARDIIDEVEKQLRSVKLQAAKAQRYQEYSKRLKELRVALGLQEYHELTERLRAETSVLEGLRTGLAEQAAQAEACDADTRRLEDTLAQLEDAM